MARGTMRQRKGASAASLRADIACSEQDLRNKYFMLIDQLDAGDPYNWKEIVALSRRAGLRKDQLCGELSCAWSTVLRWEAGTSVPGPNARFGIKLRLLAMLQALGAQPVSAPGSEAAASA
jgi:DNA-binding transcriptional regulator YiaG